MRSAPFFRVEIFVYKIHIVMCSAAAAAVFYDGPTLKRAFHDFPAVTDMGGEYRAVQVAPQPFLALPFAVYVLEAGDQASEQMQAGIQFLARHINLLLEFF